MFETQYTFRNAMIDKFPLVPVKKIHEVADEVYGTGVRNFLKAVSEVKKKVQE